jgi:hypothetical protein
MARRQNTSVIGVREAALGITLTKSGRELVSLPSRFDGIIPSDRAFDQFSHLDEYNFRY